MLLDATDIAKTYPGGPQVLDGVTLSLSAGESLALTGESGSGKSTLLHILAGLEAPDRGSVRIAGTDLASLNEPARAELRRTRVGIVFQQFNLIPALSARNNLIFQAEIAGRQDPDWTAQLAEALGLTPHLGKYPEELSGGQQQRLAIGRALAARPDLVLADEPTGNLDEATGDATLALMLALVADSGAGLVMVTHSPSRAAQLGRRAHLHAGRLT